MHAAALSLAVALANLAGQQPDLHLVTVVFTGQGPLGLAFRKSVVPVTIKKISPDTLAASRSQLRPGMQLLAVGDRSVDSMGYDQAIALLRSSPRPMSLRFGRPRSGKPSAKGPPR